MHTPYEERLKRPPDFRVSYRFYTHEEGGRQTIPYQGYRSDFWYQHNDHKPRQLFMIWPEFENENGNVILENDRSVPSAGTARMWIVVCDMTAYHWDKIHVGMKGYFMEGPNKVAECEVIEIMNLSSKTSLT